ncbi:MAG: hypothetical protein RJA49_2982 [Actinomycetota bacterium]|jgi:uncharacterized protein YkwD
MRITRTILAIATSAAIGLGALAVPAAEALVPAPAVVISPKIDVLSVAQRCTALVNYYRRVNGRRAVVIDVRIQAAAQLHSNYQARKSLMTHTGYWWNGAKWLPTDAGFREKLQKYTWSWWGENVAAGQANCDVVVKAWMNSPHHRDNILNPNFTHIGVAARKSVKGTIFWTMDFGRPG